MPKIVTSTPSEQVQTIIVTRLAQLHEMVEAVENAEFIAVDVETTGLQNSDRVVCIAIAVSPIESYCIPLKVWQSGELVVPWSAKAYDEVVAALHHMLEHPKQLYHNANFDARMIQNSFGIEVIDKVYCDTQLLHHTAIDENPPHGLKENAAKYLDPDAANPQDDLKQSVIANGGKWVMAQKDMYMGDWKLLTTYNCWDVLYTFRLFELWYPEIEKQGLQDLWNLEVMPLLKVTYEMNMTGIKVNIPYFEKLKVSMEERIEALEDEIYASARGKIHEYEIGILKEAMKITKQSQAGKYLLSKGLPLEWNDQTTRLLYDWHNQAKKQKRVFNLDSTNDKAFLLYDVMELPVKAMTASGKRSTNKAIIDSLIEEFEDSSDLLRLVKERSKELKLVNTYVEPILETHEGGRIYPSFMQTGTTSGRFSCGGRSINLQTLPRDDKRIKAGFIPDEGFAFIADDYASLEPRTFAEVSGEPGILRIFREGLDFYSTIAIDVMGLKGVSAHPDDDNYLGKVNKALRQEFKAIVLAVPYGAEGGRISQLLKVDYEKGKELVEKYLKTYPKLKQWMDRAVWDMKTKGFVISRAGRKKRGALVHELYTNYKVKDFSKRSLMALWARRSELQERFPTDIGLYLECRNLFNVSRNHQIQSLAGSICNTGMIDTYNRLKAAGMKTKIVANIHDEIVMISPLHEVTQASIILQESMETNRVTTTMSVKMIAVPVSTTVSLAEAK